MIAPSLIVILLIFALIPRFNAAKNASIRSFDEGLYNYLGTQLKYQPLNYSSSNFYKLMAKYIRNPKERERVKRYVDVPLFKHPPLFCYLIAISKTLFGDEYMPANFVSLFSGVAIIFVVYFLCKSLWGEIWGLLAAFFMAIEPNYWLCSQKIWIETTLGLFVYLGIFFLYLGRKRTLFLIISGVCLGMALLCKYSAILAVIAIYAIILFTDIIPDRKKMLLYVLTPFIVGLPWVLWNYNVYGNNLFYEIMKINSSAASFKYITKFSLIAAVPVILMAGFFTAKYFFKDKLDEILAKTKGSSLAREVKNFSYFLIAIFTAILFLLSGEHFLKALDWTYLPVPTNLMDPFKGQPGYFYFYHMARISLLFLISYFSVLFIKKWDEWNFLLAAVAISLFTFFGLFKAYESRFVIIAMPALMMLAAYTVKESLSLCLSRSGWMRTVPAVLIIMVVMYAVAKTLYFDFTVVVKNNFFFF